MSAEDKKRDEDTCLIHDGLSYRGDTGPITPPVYLTSTFEHGNQGGFDYTRSGNPNFRNLESVLSGLEDSIHATVFGSGVAAITAIASTLHSGDLILAEENIYGCTYRLFEQVFRKFGIRVEYLDFSSEESFSQVKERKPTLVWIESPTNPLLKIIDVEHLASICQQHDVPLVIDNTFASGYLQKPLQLGATLSLSSTTKYIGGHSDCLGGVVCTNSLDWQEKLVFAQKALGLNPSAFDAWLLTRGVRTLGARMKEHCKGAFALARFFESQTRAPLVRYPFLKSHPQSEIAQRQMRGGSGIVTVDLGLGIQDTLRFLKELTLFTLAESLGGIESLVCHPASMTHASVPKEVKEATGISDSLIRFSVGIESAEDLIEDVRRALPTGLEFQGTLRPLRYSAEGQVCQI